MIAVNGLTAALKHELEVAGIDAPGLLSQCSEVILCGSRALGRERRGSDWDLIAVGGKIRRRKRQKIDLIPIHAERAQTQEWLESELAWHVRTYGIWLSGSAGLWVSQVSLTNYTLQSKIDRIEYRLNQIDQVWSFLNANARKKYVVLLRRDLQRYHQLKFHLEIPPSPILDDVWQAQVCNAGAKSYIDSLLSDLPGSVGKDIVERLNTVQGWPLLLSG